jgi:hypothetical protein
MTFTRAAHQTWRRDNLRTAMKKSLKSIPLFRPLIWIAFAIVVGGSYLADLQGDRRIFYAAVVAALIVAVFDVFRNLRTM